MVIRVQASELAFHGAQVIVEQLQFHGFALLHLGRHMFDQCHLRLRGVAVVNLDRVRDER